MTVVRLPTKLEAIEFFAGVGLARAGLARAGVQVVWANDVSPIKRAMYAATYGGDHYHVDDIAKVKAADLPQSASIAWASSPCTDLSLAGDRAGLAGHQS